MLEAQAAGEGASPMEFSLSVHNAPAGQFSAAREDRSQSASLAACGETFTSALLEGAGLVAEGHERVLVVMSDAMPPDVFAGRWEGEPAGYSLGLLLGASQGEEFRLSLREADATVSESGEPQSLVFLRMLASGSPAADWRNGTRHWRWVRP